MSRKAKIRVGDTVRFMWGTTKVTGIVKEDRGPIGLKGRNLYGIYSTPEPEFSFYIELPAEAIEVVKESVASDEDA